MRSLRSYDGRIELYTPHNCEGTTKLQVMKKHQMRATQLNSVICAAIKKRKVFPMDDPM
ncbi:hypothetical protein GQQ23_14515 [Pantoea agglomerans]|nr:hypothetical protein [Pantoea agglomerans]